MSCSLESENSNNVNDTPVIKKQSVHEITHGVKQISNSQVCMVNDKFMNKDQIPVSVHDKIYYGCCEGCVSALKQDSTHQFGHDPLTGEKVDKANAVIIIKPGTTDEVLYFLSETNAKRYIETYDGH